MKVCRWKIRPAFVCFATLLACLLVISYQTFNSTAVAGSNHGPEVFIRGAYKRGTAETVRGDYDHVTRSKEPKVPLEQFGNVAEETVVSMELSNKSFDPAQTITRKDTFIPSRLIVHLDLKGGALRPERFRCFFEYFAKLGITGVLMEWEDMFPYQGRLSSVRNGDAYTMQDVQRILEDAAHFNLKVIPLVQTIGHLEWVLKVPEFTSLRESENYPQAICVSNDEAVELVLDMVKQVMDVHKDAEFVHIGCDEVYQYAECKLCTARIQREKVISREELVVKHISKVAKYIIDNYQKKVLVWHDFLAIVAKETADRYNIRNAVEPVIWNYAEDLSVYMPSGTWQLFADMADYVWGASAFKGADGPTRYHSNVLHYLKNHESWLNEMKMAHKQFKEFRGLMITGWSRYDHLSGLCELLPIGIPSLTVSALTIRNGRRSAQVDQQSLKMMKCLETGDITTELSSCSFPGSNIYNAVQQLYKLTDDIQNVLFKAHSIQGWLSEYNLKQNVSSPWILKSILPDIENYRWQLMSTVEALQKAMSEFYFQNTVDEFLATYADPLLSTLNEMYNSGVSLMGQKHFPVRPFSIKRDIS